MTVAFTTTWFQVDEFHVSAAVYVPVDKYRSTVLRRRTRELVCESDPLQLYKGVSECEVER